MLVDHGGWRKACLILALGTVFFWGLTWWLWRKVNRTEHPHPGGNGWSNITTVLTNRLNYPVLIGVSFSASVSLCLQMTIGQNQLT